MALLVLRRVGFVCRAKPNVPFAGWQIVLKNVRWGKIKNSGSGKRVGLFLVRSLYIFYVAFHFPKWFTLSFYSVSVYSNGVFSHLLPTVGACDVAGQEGLKMERSGMSSPTSSSLSTCINIVRKTKPGNTPDPRHGHLHNVRCRAFQSTYS